MRNFTGQDEVIELFSGAPIATIDNELLNRGMQEAMQHKQEVMQLFQETTKLLQETTQLQNNEFQYKEMILAAQDAVIRNLREELWKLKNKS